MVLGGHSQQRVGRSSGCEPVERAAGSQAMTPQYGCRSCRFDRGARIVRCIERGGCLALQAAGEAARRPRYPKMARDTDGRALCRGCRAVVPAGRKTWCSRECYKTHCPAEVNAAAWRRDEGRCQICSVDISAAQREHHKMKRDLGWNDYGKWREWQKAHPLPKANYDHIKPHSEGGEHALSNIRTLCSKCHKAVTAEWRRSRARKTH